MKATPSLHSLTIAVFSGSVPSAWMELGPTGVTWGQFPRAQGSWPGPGLRPRLTLGTSGLECGQFTFVKCTLTFHPLVCVHPISTSYLFSIFRVCTAAVSYCLCKSSSLSQDILYGSLSPALVKKVGLSIPFSPLCESPVSCRFPAEGPALCSLPAHISALLCCCVSDCFLGAASTVCLG